LHGDAPFYRDGRGTFDRSSATTVAALGVMLTVLPYLMIRASGGTPLDASFGVGGAIEQRDGPLPKPAIVKEQSPSLMS
jgi:hypothetical protein